VVAGVVLVGVVVGVEVAGGGAVVVVVVDGAVDVTVELGVVFAGVVLVV
jgi:hypothetical protein